MLYHYTADIARVRGNGLRLNAPCKLISDDIEGNCTGQRRAWPSGMSIKRKCSPLVAWRRTTWLHVRINFQIIWVTIGKGRQLPLNSANPSETYHRVVGRCRQVWRFEQSERKQISISGFITNRGKWVIRSYTRSWDARESKQFRCWLSGPEWGNLPARNDGTVQAWFPFSITGMLYLSPSSSGYWANRKFLT